MIRVIVGLSWLLVCAGLCVAQENAPVPGNAPTAAPDTNEAPRRMPPAQMPPAASPGFFGATAGQAPPEPDRDRQIAGEDFFLLCMFVAIVGSVLIVVARHRRTVDGPPPPSPGEA